MRRKLRIAMVALFATAATVIGTAAPALAADGKQLATDSVGPLDEPKWYCTNGSANALACFAPLGEWFGIEDTWEDTYPVVVDWRFFDDEVSPTGAIVRQGRIWHTAGYVAGARYMNKSFPENQPGITLKQISFRACSGNYPSNTVFEGTCSAWRTVGT
ncbi:hypothetical protein [Micromonospora lupini]|uniref:Secreted protein n=1 Tax=Micromonospora lupini str. Lupac 08 TaxID=1150864 RepID=I0L705_9ACTN|nr:hypothetical protein [Micromonospora lupini]CCH19602.1 Exported hypothetical protein [Micromonospora lupini str. Lupac 08]